MAKFDLQKGQKSQEKKNELNLNIALDTLKSMKAKPCYFFPGKSVHLFKKGMGSRAMPWGQCCRYFFLGGFSLVQEEEYT